MKKKANTFERTPLFAVDILIAYAILRYAFHAPRPWTFAYVWSSVTVPLYYIEKAVGSR